MGYGGSSSYSGSATGSNNLGTTVQSADAFLKDWYLGDRQSLNKLMYPKDEALMRLKRFPASGKVQGRKMVVPMRIGRSPSQSKNFIKAQNQAKKRTGARGVWLVEYDNDFGLARVENKVIKASVGMQGAFIKEMIDETDAAVEGLRQKRCTALFAPEYAADAARNSIGKVKSSAVVGAKSVVTLTDAGNAANFDIGDELIVRNATGAVTRAGGVAVVESVDRQAGTVGLNRTVAALAANDILIRDGDEDQVGLTSFNQWLPAKTAGNAFSVSDKELHGLDRSLDRARLAGFYSTVGTAAKADAANKPAAQPFTLAIRRMISQINALTGSAPDLFFCNPLVEDAIAKEQSANIRLDVSQGGAAQVTGIGMGKLAIKHSKGMTEIVTSSFCPIAECYLIDTETFGLMFLGGEGDDFVDFARNKAGGILLDAYDASGVEIRVESYGNLVCNAPGRNGRLHLNQGLVDTITD